MNKKKLALITASGIALFSANLVHAEQNVADATADMSANSVTNSNSQSTVVTEEIASPIRYEEDVTQEVGYKEIKSQGTSGTITYTTKDNQTTVSRVEPTETVIALGTKSKVEEVVDQANTEYTLDENRDFGDNQIVQESVNGVKKEETTYRVAPDTSKYASEDIGNETYRYTPEQFYSIDDSQELPSDKIVVDKLFVTKEGDLASLEALPDKDKSIRERAMEKPWQPSRQEGNSYISYPGELLGKDKAQSSDLKPNWLVLDKSESEKLTSEQLLNLEIFSTSFADLLKVSSGDYLTVSDENHRKQDSEKQVDDIRTYYDSHNISQGLYADIKADYLRLVYAKELLEKDGLYTEKVEEAFKNATEFFQVLTRRYNNDQGVVGVDIDYTTTKMSQEDRDWLEGVIQALPEQLRKNLVKLYVTDDDLPPAAKTTTPIGLAYYNTKKVGLHAYTEYKRDVIVENPVTGQDEIKEIHATDYKYRILTTLLHELSHVVDYNSGLSNVSVGPATLIQTGLSTSKEFRDVYDKYVKNSIMNPYYRDNPEETFAEGFGRYLSNRFFGIPYPHYKELNGKVYAVRVGEKYYNTTSNPLEEIAYYFDNIYNKLFEQPVEGKVVVKQVQSQTSSKQDGKVIYGAKPVEHTETIAYKTYYKSDDSQDYGVVVEVGGENGQKVTRTTYILENNQPKAVQSVIRETPAVDKVVTKGTKASVAKVNSILPLVKYIDDATLEQGKEVTVQEGVEGFTTVTTTYMLNTETGEISTKQESVTTPMSEKLIRRGTKVVEEVVPSKPTDSTEISDTTKPTDSTEISDTTKPTDSIANPDTSKPTDSLVNPDTTKPTDNLVNPDTTKTVDSMENPDISKLSDVSETPSMIQVSKDMSNQSFVHQIVQELDKVQSKARVATPTKVDSMSQEKIESTNKMQNQLPQTNSSTKQSNFLSAIGLGMIAILFGMKKKREEN